MKPNPAREYGDSSERETNRTRWLGVAWCALAVVVCEILIFRYLFQYGLSNVCAIDGASQQFPAYLYLHQWFDALLQGRALGFGLWSWRLGLGADALTSLAWHIADPFSMLGYLFPIRYLEYVLEAVYFLRILCAGLSAYAYFRTMKATQFAATAGALVYVFSTFLMELTIRQPFFVNPMVWLPLILIGVEHLLARRRWYLLVGALAIAAADDYYFAYKLVLIAVIYAIARWVETTPNRDRLRRLLPDGLRIAGFFLLGIALSAWMLAPAALSVVGSSRAVSQYGFPLTYRISDYLTYLVALTSALKGAHSFEGGYSIVGVLGVLALFLRRDNTALKFMLGACAAILLVPILGLIANGLSFPSYRFMFVGGLFVGAAVAVVLSDTRPLPKRELGLVGIGFAVFAAADLAACVLLRRPLLLAAVPVALGAVAWMLLALESRGAPAATDGGEAGEAPIVSATPGRPSVWRLGVLAIIVLGIAANGVASFDRHFNPSLEPFLPFGTVYSRFQNNPGALASTLPTEGLQRIDKQVGAFGSDLGESQSNDPLAQGYAGLDFYYSVMADGMHQYTKGLSDRAKRLGWDYEGFDDRAALDTLNAVRYYITPTQGAAYVPYGFTPASTLGSATVYENRHALPIGYVYHSAVASSVYAALSPLDKQQALLQGVVLDDGRATDLPRIVPARETVEVTYTLKPSKKLTWNQATGSVSVNKARGSATLSFSPVKNAELYLQLDGVTFTNSEQLAVTAKASGPRKTDWFMSKSSDYYWGNETMLTNLGYSADGVSRATIGFLNTGKVHYTSLKVIAVPMTNFDQQVGRLAAEGMRNVRVGTDALSGTVTSNGSGLLFLSIPYSKGWTATVDGAPAQVMPANVGLSGIDIASGTHQIELRYRTPGLVAGATIALIALVIVLALALRDELRRAAARRVASPAPRV